MMRFRAVAFRLTLVGLIFVPSYLLAYSGEKLAKGAKVSIDEARAIALKAQPGSISDEDLERERGGSGRRYSFDIKAPVGCTRLEWTRRLAMSSKTRRRDAIQTRPPRHFETEVVTRRIDLAQCVLRQCYHP